MALHVVVGAGPIGSATAKLLLARGERVRMVTRRGTGVDGVEAIAADAGDAARMRELTDGAEAIYNCANPPYHRWSVEWPPIAAALLGAAEHSGAVLATTSNLYGYGPVREPMTERTPLRAGSVKGRVRAQMWRDALAAHEAGRVRAVEVRASDYVGAGSKTLFSEFVLPRVLAGRVARVPVDLDAPHTVTYVGDVARLLVAVAGDERGWGRPWHVPSEEPRSMRWLAAEAARLAGVGPVRLRPAPYAVLWALGLFDRNAREVREVHYQFTAPFVMDSSEATARFGITPTPVVDALREMLPGKR
ncbi:NAD-dependent epimerase/dehydratase family protein [Rugosimonospora africana]|uniref:NAD-dependent epimerase n=1 Tax=Rugosimonospora africana TaxID=556532 RepID=A0A8J3QN86_9ACTN|nr:NAD-dependent epimerase/dehydratase family protein [Rugosimonospora africana]GIH12668.1 NAD-dependent epimerase [Rugosimonospora africana]